MDDYVSKVILFENPWIEGKESWGWINRNLPQHYIRRRVTLGADDRVCLVVGPRQAGKSTLIWKHLSEIDTPFLHLNCEEPAIQHWLTSPVAMLSDLKELIQEPVPLFFEEIQSLKEAGLLLKGLVDRKIGVPIFATGNSSFDLLSKTRESLAGRAFRFLLYPFSLDELAFSEKSQSVVAANRAREGILDRMLLFGGYPNAILSAEPHRELVQLSESFIIRDVSDRFRIQYPAAFRKLLALMASQVGNLCNFSEWASVVGISNDTVAEYSNLLQETHVIRLIRPFIGGKRAELTSTPKVYFVDNGIRNLLFGGFQPLATRTDIGPVVENFAFTEILKNTHPLLDSIRYWRTKAGAEIDFVIEHQGKIIACEIKAGDTRGKLSRAVRSFVSAYQPWVFFTAGTKEYPEQQIESTPIRFIRLTDLGRKISELLRTAI